MNCSECKFFSDKLSSISAIKWRDGVGECRRHAPTGPAVLGWQSSGDDPEFKTAIINAFPVVPGDDWCGEFQKR